MKRLLFLSVLALSAVAVDAQIKMSLVPAVPYGSPGARNLQINLTFENGSPSFSGQTMAGYFFILRTPTSCNTPSPLALTNFSGGSGLSSALVTDPVRSFATNGTYDYRLFELNVAGTAPATWVFPNEVKLVSFTVNLPDGCTVELAPDNDPTADALIDDYYSTPGISSILYGSDINMNGNPTVIAYYAGSQTTLPLKLTSFTAAADNCTALLAWETAEEVSVSHFDIEESADGINYKKTGTVKALGSALVNKYSFRATDNKGTRYYRLRMVDNDGGYSYSTVRTVTGDCGGAGSFSVYPNPFRIANDVLTIRYSLPQAGAVQVVLYNAAGQQVLGRTLNAMAGMNQQQVQVPNISKGAYYLKVTDKEGKEIGAQQLIIK